MSQQQQPITSLSHQHTTNPVPIVPLQESELTDASNTTTDVRIIKHWVKCSNVKCNALFKISASDQIMCPAVGCYGRVVEIPQPLGYRTHITRGY